MTESRVEPPATKPTNLALRIAIGAVAIGLTLALPLLRERVAADVNDVRAPAPVEAENLRLVPSERSLVLHGVVRASERTMPGFTVPGRVVARPVSLGEHVDAGQILARLDGSGFRNQTRAAQAQLTELEARAAQLRRDEARVAALQAEGVSTAAELEATQTGQVRLSASREAAEAQLAESRRQSREAVLRAPFAGVVREVFVEPGQVVAAGTPVVALAGAGGLEIEVEVPSRAVAWVDQASVDVELADGDEPDTRRVSAEVREVAEVAGLRGLFAARVELPPGSARPGEGALVRFRRAGGEELRAPTSGVFDPSGDRPFVWGVVSVGEEDVVRRFPVRVLGLRVEGERAEVALRGDGLGPELRIVTRGAAHLLEGDRVMAPATMFAEVER